MTKKYTLTDDTKIIIDGENKRTLHRIQALEDFGGDIWTGDLGGWVESENNLSQYGTCWVYDNAMVYGFAWVTGDANVMDNAVVANKAKVMGNAVVREQAVILDMAIIQEQALIEGCATVYDSAIVGDTAVVFDEAEIYGYACVGGNSGIFGNAQIYDQAIINGNSHISRNADIADSSHYVLIDSLGDESESLTFFRDEKCGISVHCSWFSGSIKGFGAAVLKNCNEKNQVLYKKAIELAQLSIEEKIYYED